MQPRLCKPPFLLSFPQQRNHLHTWTLCTRMYTGITKCFKFEEGTAKGAARTYLQGCPLPLQGE